MANNTLTLYSMEPMLPSGSHKDLENLAVLIIEKSARMSAQLQPEIQRSTGDLVRTMNCYYSNLIEGHNTHPRDIEKALADDFSDNEKKRDLQLEARAHIEVQNIIDHKGLVFDVFSQDSIKFIHKEFYSRPPGSLCWAENPDTGKMIAVIPGTFRTSDVIVGRHIPPRAEKIESFLKRFQEAYDFSKLSRMAQIISIAAAHHRLLWIHPFYDGNGRVTRLQSHAAFLEAGVGNSLWSISRGLARNSQEYKRNLQMADFTRQGDFDGRGALSQENLLRFCTFFLKTAIDQIDFMQELLNIPTLLDRIDRYAQTQIMQKELPKGSASVLKEALIKGKLLRKSIANLTGYSERQSRSIISALIKRRLLISHTPYGELYLNFPQDAVEYYFPKLYPNL